jgi:cytochrome c-type biogenesis protein CcmH
MLRRGLWLAVSVAFVVSIGVVILRSGDETPSARAQRLARGFACPVCRGESIAASNSSDARAIRAEIERQIAAGASDAEIRQRFVDDWGPDHLLEPDRRGLGAVVWVLPVVVIGLGGALLVLTLQRWTDAGRFVASEADETIVARLRADRTRLASQSEPDASRAGADPGEGVGKADGEADGEAEGEADGEDRAR